MVFPTVTVAKILFVQIAAVVLGGDGATDAQRLERVDAGRAASGNPAREERDGNHEHRHER